MVDLGRVEGCIFGHAVGDALGAPVEFMPRESIIQRFGTHGVTDLRQWQTSRAAFRKGSWTDDTQMLVATAHGLLDAAEFELREESADPVDAVYARYLEWLATQDDPGQDRYPGATCLDALRAGIAGTTFDPINDRKGTGGIMRVAPVGIVLPPERAFEMAVDIAALTHGHPTGFLAAGAYADVLSRVVRGVALPQAVAEAREHLLGLDDAGETIDAIDLATELFISDEYIVEGIERIGEGWVAEEALAIALFCALNFPADFALGVLSAVNITGDSDTTGALTGALLGAILGPGAIPGSWLMVLEKREMLRKLSQRLHEIGVS